jgi:hypothetical protein
MGTQFFEEEQEVPCTSRGMARVGSIGCGRHRRWRAEVALSRPLNLKIDSAFNFLALRSDSIVGLAQSSSSSLSAKARASDFSLACLWRPHCMAS